MTYLRTDGVSKLAITNALQNNFDFYFCDRKQISNQNTLNLKLFISKIIINFHTKNVKKTKTLTK